MSKNEYTLGPWVITLEVRPFTDYSDHAGRLLTGREVQDGQAGDGIILEANDSTASIHTCDCLPLVITTTAETYLLHISRKTLLTPLLEKTAARINRETVTEIFIGPHICADHFVFEYEGEEIKAFAKKFPLAVRSSERGIGLSLLRATEHFIERYTRLKIIRDGRCTYEDPTLPSYKRWLEQGKRGELLGLYTTLTREV